MSHWGALATQVLAGEPISADDARSIVRSSDDDLLPLLGAAFRIRQQYHGRDVRLHVLQNAKSGHVPGGLRLLQPVGRATTPASSATACRRSRNWSRAPAGARAWARSSTAWSPARAARRQRDLDDDLRGGAADQGRDEHQRLHVARPAHGRRRRSSSPRRASTGSTTTSRSSTRFFPEICETHTLRRPGRTR